MADVPEPLPCPFCGTAGPLGGSTLDEGCYVMCRNEDCFGMVGYFESQSEADAAWNTRAAPPAVDREAANMAAFHAMYGKDTDPFIYPEALDFASKVADAILAALSTLSADAIRQEEGSEVERDVTYEVWQDEICFATSTDEADARHYLDVYGQDGPAKLMHVVTVRTEIAATPASHASDGGGGMSAVISPCGLYRYRLERQCHGIGSTAIIMVNPSTADAAKDDATIRKLRGFGDRHGWGRIIVGNLFAYRATDVRELGMAIDPIGPENDEHLLRIADEAVARLRKVASGATVEAAYDIPWMVDLPAKMREDILAALDSRAGDAGEGERIAIREFLIACADAADFQASRYGGGLAMVRCRVEAKAYRNAARMIFEQDHASYRPATPAPAVDAVPAGEVETCSFADCPPGLFRWNGLLCFKSEYSTKAGQPDAYCVDSGEYFWGGTSGDLEKRRNLMVQPVTSVSLSHGEGRK